MSSVWTWYLLNKYFLMNNGVCPVSMQMSLITNLGYSVLCFVIFAQ